MNLVVVIRFKNNLDKAPIETGSRRYAYKTNQIFRFVYNLMTDLCKKSNSLKVCIISIKNQSSKRVK
jgi:hypothetical protein